jgi:hypothetical protein
MSAANPRVQENMLKPRTDRKSVSPFWGSGFPRQSVCGRGDARKSKRPASVSHLGSRNLLIGRIGEPLSAFRPAGQGVGDILDFLCERAKRKAARRISSCVWRFGFLDILGINGQVDEYMQSDTKCKL